MPKIACFDRKRGKTDLFTQSFPHFPQSFPQVAPFCGKVLWRIFLRGDAVFWGIFHTDRRGRRPLQARRVVRCVFLISRAKKEFSFVTPYCNSYFFML